MAQAVLETMEDLAAHSQVKVVPAAQEVSAAWAICLDVDRAATVEAVKATVSSKALSRLLPKKV